MSRDFKNCQFAVLPLLSTLIALLVAFVSFFATPRHFFQGIVFAVIVVVAGRATFVQCKDSEIRKALKKTAQRVRPVRSTIAIICWGSFGAILVFTSELGLIFGGWQFLQGSKFWGTVWAGTGAAIVALGLLPGDRQTNNPIRKAVVALQDDDQDHSVKFIDRQLAPPANGVGEPPAWPDLWASAWGRVTR